MKIIEAEVPILKENLSVTFTLTVYHCRMIFLHDMKFFHVRNIVLLLEIFHCLLGCAVSVLNYTYILLHIYFNNCIPY